MNRKVVIAISALGIISAIASGIFSKEILLGLVLTAVMLVFCFLAILGPIILLRISAPELSEEEINKILPQGSNKILTINEFSPFYPGPSGLFFNQGLPLKSEPKKNLRSDDA